MEVAINPNSHVVQANYLLENRPKLTMDETRLFLTILSSIGMNDEDFKPLKIPVANMADLWGIDRRISYGKIKAALRGLREREFFVEGINQETGKKRFISASYVSASTYEEGQGYATIEISQIFKPYLIALKKSFTSYVLENILRLSTVNAIRNYEILKQYQKIGTRSFTIEEYKKILHIENKYKLNADLKRYVLDAAQEEINANTDLLISYKMTGRGVNAKIVFTISSKPKPTTTSTAREIPTNINNRERMLFDALPDEVHQGDLDRVRAILNILQNAIPYPDTTSLLLDGMSLEEAGEIVEDEFIETLRSKVNDFTLQEYNIRKANIKHPGAEFKYYMAALEGWLLTN